MLIRYARAGSCSAAAESTASEPWRKRFSPQDETRYDYWRRMEFTPEQWAGLKAQDAVEIGMSMADWAWAYILLGAGVVIPVWLLIAGVRYLSRRS